MSKNEKDYVAPCVMMIRCESLMPLCSSGITGGGDDFEWESLRLNSDETDKDFGLESMDEPRKSVWED